MASNPTGFKVMFGPPDIDVGYPATPGTYYDLDDVYLRKDKFLKGGLWIWGNGAGGQLGHDRTTSRSSPIQTCISGNRWRKICVSKFDGHNVLALTSTGQAWGWGCNDVAQVRGTGGADCLCPVLRSTTDTVKLITTGGAAGIFTTSGVSDGVYDACTVGWGCSEGDRLNIAVAGCPTIWADVSLGNRFGVAIADSNLASTGNCNTTLPGSLIEWGRGRPSQTYLDHPDTVYSKNYTGGTGGTNSFSRICCAGGVGAEPLALSGDYTVEFFTRQCPGITGGSVQKLLDMRCPVAIPGSFMPAFSINPGNCICFEVRLANGTYSTAFSTLSLSDNVWYHVAASRINDKTQFYVNGIRYGCICDNFTHVNTYVTLSADGFDAACVNDCYAGSLSNIRIIKGAGIYDGACADIPVPPLGLISNATADTTLLLAVNSNTTDQSPSNLTVVDLNTTNTEENFNLEFYTACTLSSDSWRYISAGNTHALAIKCDGTLWAWGCNGRGQLGTGDTINRSRPVQVGTSNNWTAITAGCNFSAGILAGRFKSCAAVIYTWGENSSGQLGDNTTLDRSSPVQTSSSYTNWKQVSAGDSHFAAIQTDGTIWTWGSNQNGELGVSDRVNRSSPVQIQDSGTGWFQVSAGQCVTAALKDNGW